MSLSSFLMGANTWFDAQKACLTRKSAEIDGYTVHYYEGGSGPTLVLLHGLGDDKNSFVRTSAELTSKFHVVLPDLAGHGENARDPRRDYSIRGHVEHLHAFVRAKGLGRFHLGGNSMGGHTSLAYAIHHPEDVDRLILVNAPGLRLDDGHVVYTGFGDRVKTVEQFNAVLDRVYAKRPKLPGFLVQHLMAQLDEGFDLTNAMVHAVKTGADAELDDRLSEVRAATLVLWGKHDVVVPFRVAETFRERIRNATLVVLEEGAHSPQLEIPTRVASEILAFLTP